MKKNIAYLVFIGACLGMLFGLTACGPVVGEEPPPEVTTQAPPVEREEPEVEPVEPREDIAQFGKSGFTFDDGVHVAISNGEEFKPDPYAGAEEAPHYLRWTVTLTNGSDQTFDPSMFLTYTASAGVEHAEIFDGDLGTTPSVPLPPGKSVSFDIGYPVEDPADVLMSVAVDWERPEVLFSN